MERIKRYIRRERAQMRLLLRSVPATVVTLFVVSVVCMNLLANKTLIQLEWIALDAGTLISWVSFLCMDIITRHFGPKASNQISLLAAGINILTCFFFYIASIIPSNAADYRTLDSILGGTWFILLGSTVAFLSSAVINNTLNHAIGKAFSRNPHGRAAYAARTYISTFIGQFMDNLIFSVIVFMGFAPIFWGGFHWTLLQCVMCALTGAVAELLMEVVFSPIGYRIAERWRKEKVGAAYLEQLEGKE